jgi:hypothetical protein
MADRQLPCKSPLMVMPANHSSAIVHYWAGKYPGRLGWLIGPTALPKTKLRPWMPFALDNDAFSAWAKSREWDEGAWIAGQLPPHAELNLSL